MISVDLKRSDDATPTEIVVTLDEPGLESLLAQLQFLSQKKTDHVDLMSREWGGSHLSGIPQETGRDPVHYVKIMLLPRA